jgi:hypothetical protein
VSSEQPFTPAGPITAFLARLTTDDDLLATWYEDRDRCFDQYASLEDVPDEHVLSDDDREALRAEDLDAVRGRIAVELDVDASAIWMVIWMRGTP